MFFLQPAAAQVREALSAWRWLPLKGKTPLTVTALGDVFLSDEHGVWFLDRIAGTLELVAESETALEVLLNTENGQEHYLWYELIEAAQADITLGEDECFDFKVAPRLGGELSVDNLHSVDFVDALHVAGQMHEQVKDLAPGTVVDNIEIN